MKKLMVLVTAAGALCAAQGELLFKCDFDGTAVASFAKGKAEPVQQKDLSFVPGLHGQALHVGKGKGVSLLAYATEGNFNRPTGTIAFWYKPDEVFSGDADRRTFFETEFKGKRGGSGAVMVWTIANLLRGDLSDDADRYVRARGLLGMNGWNHVAFTWNGASSALYVNGRPIGAHKSDSASPLAAAYGKTWKGRKPMPKYGLFSYANLQQAKRFFVGSSKGHQGICGSIDNLRVWSEPLGETAVKRLREEEKTAESIGNQRPDYEKVFAGHVNSCETAPLDIAGMPGEMELVAEWRAGEEVPEESDRFKAIGLSRIGRLGAVNYLESGPDQNNRFALRFRLDPKAPLHCFEIDYPDDAVRSADIVVQCCKKPLLAANGSSDYTMQVGYATGDEYANTGKILTHRCLYWTRSDDVALVMMTARAKRPAAIAAVRVYRVKSGKLPVAKVNEPPAADDGWRRSFALYYEDPAIYGDFARIGNSPEKAHELIDRVAALMKYTGQNILCYPGVWYQGEIGHDYMPRPHPPCYREAYYAAFDAEGLGFMPTMNPNEVPVADGLITSTSVHDGSLHSSQVSILATGEPNPGGWHSTPPNYNIAHPLVQRHLLECVDRFIAEGAKHPSFKGVCLHLTRHSPMWFGDYTAGFNDYAVEAFAKAKGVKMPASIDRSAALRGKAYADWITNTCEKAWLDWRCEQVTKVWKALAARLAAARPDLKLMINTFLLVRSRDFEFGAEDTIQRSNRHAGYEPERLKDVPNLIVCQTVVPADYRWMHEGRYVKEKLEAHRLYQRTRYLVPSDFDLFKTARWPWINQHDRYWESPVGNKNRSAATLDCEWMDETRWRVSTINPSGRHALRQYAVPFRYNDVLGLSKGGFLIGTYGSEDVLVPWIQAFRALPAVKMAEVGRKGNTVVRQAAFRGKSYFYICNTDERAAEFSLRLPKGSVDLVTGEAVEGKATLSLKPYELRSYVAPSGKPVL